jgi:NAD(P)-dependent dehydrogenase (short-subunit alcohol dehydrogenase family)
MAYGHSKLANLLFITALQRRNDADRPITAAGAHPGLARTEVIVRPDDSLATGAFTKVMSRLIVVAATSAEVSAPCCCGTSSPGDRRRSGPAKLAALEKDPAIAARLWGESEALMHPGSPVSEPRDPPRGSRGSPDWPQSRVATARRL